MLESWPTRVVGSAATPNRDNSTPSLYHFLTQGDTKTEKKDVHGKGVTYDHLLSLQ